MAEQNKTNNAGEIIKKRYYITKAELQAERDAADAEQEEFDMSEQIEKCPFCGATCELGSMGGIYNIICSQCGYLSRDFDYEGNRAKSKASAIAAHNSVATLNQQLNEERAKVCFGDWYCPDCKKRLGQEGITPEEKCDTCGADTLWVLTETPGMITNLRAKVEELQAVVDKLPTDAEGNACTGGEVLWLEGCPYMVLHVGCEDNLNGHPGSGWTAIAMDTSGGFVLHDSADVELCSSIKAIASEAAQAAKTETQ
jgi:hypothetical protein